MFDFAHGVHTDLSDFLKSNDSKPVVVTVPAFLACRVKYAPCCAPSASDSVSQYSKTEIAGLFYPCERGRLCTSCCTAHAPLISETHHLREFFPFSMNMSSVALRRLWDRFLTVNHKDFDTLDLFICYVICTVLDIPPLVQLCLNTQRHWIDTSAGDYNADSDCAKFICTCLSVDPDTLETLSQIDVMHLKDPFLVLLLVRLINIKMKRAYVFDDHSASFIDQFHCICLPKANLGHMHILYWYRSLIVPSVQHKNYDCVHAWDSSTIDSLNVAYSYCHGEDYVPFDRTPGTFCHHKLIIQNGRCHITMYCDIDNVRVCCGKIWQLLYPVPHRDEAGTYIIQEPCECWIVRNVITFSMNNEIWIPNPCSGVHSLKYIMTSLFKAAQSPVVCCPETKPFWMAFFVELRCACEKVYPKSFDFRMALLLESVGIRDAHPKQDEVLCYKTMLTYLDEACGLGVVEILNDKKFFDIEDQWTTHLYCYGKRKRATVSKILQYGESHGIYMQCRSGDYCPKRRKLSNQPADAHSDETFMITQEDDTDVGWK